MHRPDTGEFVTGADATQLHDVRDTLLAQMKPEQRNSLQDERMWPIFRTGETVFVRNSEGAEAKCAVESIGKKFMQLRGLPR